MTRDEWIKEYGEPCTCGGQGFYLTSPMICGSCDRRVLEPDDLGPEPPKDGKGGRWFSTEIEGAYVMLPRSSK